MEPHLAGCGREGINQRFLILVLPGVWCVPVTPLLRGLEREV